MRPYYRDPPRYWNERHGRFEAGALRGVGAIGSTEEANAGDYAKKWAMLEPLLTELRRHGARTLLDAGTGIGYFASRAAKLGYVVDAFDFSEVAVAQNRQSDAHVRSWQVASLAAFSADHPYDAVICIDVLFHIVSDEEWERSVRNLAAVTAPSGSLIIQETLVPALQGEDVSGRSHTRWRTFELYGRVLDGWDLVEHLRYALPGEDAEKDLMMYRRTGATPEPKSTG